MDYDAIIIGAGHNGLITACYLAKAGLKVLVLERRPIVGGAVCTQDDLLPGYRIDVGSSAHIMIHGTPILQELELETRFGLSYIDMDPWASHPVPGTDKILCFHRDVDATCASIAQVSEHDARAYRDFVQFWGPLNRAVFDVFLQPPTPARFLTALAKAALRDPAARRVYRHPDLMRRLFTQYGRLVQETFRSEPVRAAMTWLAAQSGPPPDELASGDLLGWYAMLHTLGAKRARGGSGALTQALARCLVHHRGEARVDAPATRIELDSTKRAVAVHVRGERLTARAVIAACHVQTAFLELLGPDQLPDELAHRVRHLRVGNGFGMIVRHAVSELPQYPGLSSDARGIHPVHGSLQLLCPSTAYLDRALQEYRGGNPPREPAVVAMTFSAIDPSLAPPGKHTLFTWAQYYPYALAGDASWDDIREREADRIWEVVCRHAPHMRGKMEGRFIQTPPDLERLLGLVHGNVMHLEMSFDQMFQFRPLPELARYRTPFPGLYLTGASTHPGGGVFGASGYNCARVALADLVG